jgi:hypothetical protein
MHPANSLNRRAQQPEPRSNSHPQYDSTHHPSHSTTKVCRSQSDVHAVRSCPNTQPTQDTHTMTPQSPEGDVCQVHCTRGF